MITALNKLQSEGTPLNTTKGTYDEPMASTTLNEEQLQTFSVRQQKRQRIHSYHMVQCSTRKCNQSNQTRERNKQKTYKQQRKKIKLSLTVDSKFLYIEDHKNSVKMLLDLVIDDTVLQAWCPLEFPAPQLPKNCTRLGLVTSRYGVHPIPSDLRPINGGQGKGYIGTHPSSRIHRQLMINGRKRFLQQCSQLQVAYISVSSYSLISNAKLTDLPSKTWGRFVSLVCYVPYGDEQTVVCSHKKSLCSTDKYSKVAR